MGYRRLLAVTLCGGFVPLFLFGQQSPPTQKKILTPEKKAYHQQRNEWLAKRHNLQAQAKQVFDAEMAREKAGDCLDAHTTYNSNICLGKQAAITGQSLKSYEGIIRELMVPPPQMWKPAGPSPTPSQLTAEFDRLEQSWRQYRDVACAAAFHQFDGGTGGSSFESECELKLTRDHMRQLDMIYDGDLHR